MRIRSQTAIPMAALLLAIAALLVPGSAAARAQAKTMVPAGNAWGTYAKVGNAVESGRTALAILGCSSTHQTNDVAAAHAPGLSTGVVRSRLDALRVKGGTGSRAVDSIHDLNLLSGLITADTVRAVSKTSYDGARFSGGGGGSSFVDLQIAGKHYSAKASGRIKLPGIGYVFLSRRTEARQGAVHRTDMVVVRITRDVPRLHVTAGTVIVVGHALSSVHSAGGILAGFAFGSHAAVSGVPLGGNAGRSALVHVSCDGTDGQLVSNQIADLGLPNLFSADNVQSTAFGDVGADTANLQLTDTVEEADLLNGLIHAKTIRAVAAGSAAHGRLHFSPKGSGFAQLSVKGFPGIDASVPANTRLFVPGLGVLWLHRVIRHQNRIEVRMIELVVTKANSLGLPVGADVQVAVARAAIR